jgi:NodT family efflux transporter outer membrane factor (OMF) lipoprotein
MARRRLKYGAQRNALRRSRTALAAPLLTTLAACSLAPPYRVPETPAPPSAYQELGSWQPAQPLDERPKGEWWRSFDDPALDALEARLEGGNLDIQAAFARLQQARAATRIARADLFPTVTASSYIDRSRVSSNSPQYQKGNPTEGSDFNLQADFSYELDLWGRVRNEVGSAHASEQASAGDLAALDLSVRAELAMDWFNLRSDDQGQVLLDQTVRDYQRALELTRNLFNGGAAALVDVAQAETQLHDAETQAEDIRLQRTQAEHAIAVLLGENPSSFHLDSSPLPLETRPPPIDPGQPSELIERRPDVAAAERRVAAANAQIGVARAAYFPQVILAGDGGVNSVRSATYLSAQSLFWSLGPQVSLPIFEGGRLHAQTERTKAQYREQVADYRKTVLSAFQDVEDNLAALRQLEKESQSEALAVQSTGITLEQANLQYQGGLTTYLQVTTAETAALAARQSLISIEARRLSAAVLLVKALGGGWRATSLQTKQAGLVPP